MQWVWLVLTLFPARFNLAAGISEYASRSATRLLVTNCRSNRQIGSIIRIRRINVATWEKLDDVSANIANKPWSLYWSEMKSGTKEFENFLHDPLSDMTGVLSEVEKSWSIQTTIIGHEIGLSQDLVSKLALVDPRRKMVFLTLYKHPRS